MVTANKIPANWPDALEMADKIAEMIATYWREDRPARPEEHLETARQLLREIEILVGAKSE